MTEITLPVSDIKMENEEPQNSYKQPVLIDDEKNTNLHRSAASGDLDEVKNYLEKECHNVDVENYLGWTPLMMACRNGHLETAKALLDAGADASKRNRYEINVLLVAVASGNMELVEYVLEHLLSGGISKQSLERYFSPISMAVMFNHQTIWKFLIGKYFDINSPSMLTGITPLMFSTAMDNSTAFKDLLGMGADTTTKNGIGHTAVDIATIRKRLRDFIKMEAALSPNLISNNGVSTTVPPMKNLVLQIPQTQPAQNTQVPYIVVSPQPSYFQMASPMLGQPVHLRKLSSNLSPFYAAPPPPPNVTPITPQNHQLFFPPEFSPGQFASPVQNLFNHWNMSILNATMNQSDFISPGVLNSPCT